jgi:hypothetical protein
VVDFEQKSEKVEDLLVKIYADLLEMNDLHPIETESLYIEYLKLNPFTKMFPPKLSFTNYEDFSSQMKLPPSFNDLSINNYKAYNQQNTRIIMKVFLCAFTFKYILLHCV